MVGSESPETPSGELRRLSAADTDFRKVWVLLSGILLLVMISVAVLGGRDPRALLFLSVAVIVLGIACWQVFQLKVVETDGITLFVSTMSRTMTLPLTWVQSFDDGAAGCRS